MSRYPAPDRSNFTPDQHRDDRDLPEGDLGARVGRLPDDRPCRVEIWWMDGMTLATIFFSTLDLEDASPSELLELVMAQLAAEGIPLEYRTLEADSVKTIVDASGESMYSLTFLVGLN